jgi:cell division protein FtsB
VSDLVGNGGSMEHTTWSELKTRKIEELQQQVADLSAENARLKQNTERLLRERDTLTNQYLELLASRSKEPNGKTK